VMFIRPGQAEVYAMARIESGGWSPPAPVRPPEGPAPP